MGKGNRVPTSMGLGLEAEEKGEGKERGRGSEFPIEVRSQHITS